MALREVSRGLTARRLFAWKVTGEGRILVTQITVEGTVHGDVVSLSATSGRLSLEATVAGDEMSGYGVSRISASASGEFRLKMSRQP